MTTSKNTYKSVAGHWVLKGRGKNRTYLMGTDRNANARPGDRFKATSKAGVVTTGILDELESTTDEYHVWSFTADPKTPEQRAHDRSLRAKSQAAYWESDRGIETAKRIAENKAKTMGAEATAKDETRDEATTTTTSTATSTATSEGELTDDQTAKLVELIGLGVPMADAVKVVRLMATTTTTAPTTTATTAKVTPKVTTAKTARTTAKVATAKVTDTDEATAPKGRRALCHTCDNVDHLVNVKGTQLRVCGTCSTADVDTLIRRADRMEIKRS